MKKTIAVLLIIITSMITLQNVETTAIEVELPLRIVIDGEQLMFPDAQPFIDNNNRTQTPARFIGEALGATVTWNQTKQQAKFVKDNSELLINIGSKTYQLNGKDRTMDTEAIINNDRTFVPARYVAEAFGAEVSWDQKVKTVYIKSGEGTTITTGEGNVTDYDGISFDPEKDENTRGIMTVEKHAEFCLKMAESVSFYKKDGELWMKGEFPEVPEGYRWDLHLEPFYLDKTSHLYGKFSKHEEAMFPMVGSFDIKSFEQDETKLNWIRMVIKLWNENNQYLGKFNLQTKDTQGKYENEVRYITNNGEPDIDYLDTFDFDYFNQWFK